MQARRRFQVDQAVRMTGLPIPQGDLRNHLQIEALAEHHSTRGPMPCPRSQASGDAGLATIRLGSCGNVAVRIGGRCRRRSVIDRGGGTSSGIPTVVPTEPTETKSIELPITEAGVLPTPEAGALTTPEAGVLPSPENLQAAGRPPAPTKERSAVPRHDHIVVVILENKHRSSVIGSRQATYLNKLAAKGANMTHSCGVTHPSQPNYLALFSGSTHGMRSNDARSIFGRLTTWAISSVRQASASADIRSLCRRPASGDVHRVATSASTTRGSTSARCRQPPTGLSAPSRATTASCDGVVCEPEHVSRHGRLLGPHRRPLDQKALRPVRALGATPQQLADRHLR
jgi:hypothetical protein